MKKVKVKNNKSSNINIGSSSKNSSTKSDKSNIVESLFYTFGTIFLAAIIAVCVINYKKDGRAAQAAFLPETSVTSSGTRKNP